MMGSIVKKQTYACIDGFEVWKAEWRIRSRTDALSLRRFETYVEVYEWLFQFVHLVFIDVKFVQDVLEEDLKVDLK